MGEVADAEGGDDAENGEENSQSGADGLHTFFGTETVAEIVHGAAAPFPLLIFPSVEDTENVFGIVGHHTEDSGQPHPENRTGTAGDNGGGNTGNVAGSYCGGESRAKGLELGDIFGVGFIVDLFGKNAADGGLAPVPEMSELEKFCQRGGQNSGADKKKKANFDPDELIDIAVDFHYFLQKIGHLCSSLP